MRYYTLCFALLTLVQIHNGGWIVTVIMAALTMQPVISQHIAALAPSSRLLVSFDPMCCCRLCNRIKGAADPRRWNVQSCSLLHRHNKANPALSWSLMTFLALGQVQKSCRDCVKATLYLRGAEHAVRVTKAVQGRPGELEGGVGVPRQR